MKEFFSRYSEKQLIKIAIATTATLVFFLAWVYSISAYAFSQNDIDVASSPITIMGRAVCKKPDGSLMGVNGATVKIAIKNTSKPAIEVKTDANGNFTYSFPKVGSQEKYNIKLIDKGSEPIVKSSKSQTAINCSTEPQNLTGCINKNSCANNNSEYDGCQLTNNATYSNFNFELNDCSFAELGTSDDGEPPVPPADGSTDSSSDDDNNADGDPADDGQGNTTSATTGGTTSSTTTGSEQPTTTGGTSEEPNTTDGATNDGTDQIDNENSENDGNTDSSSEENEAEEEVPQTKMQVSPVLILVTTVLFFGSLFGDVLFLTKKA